MGRPKGTKTNSLAAVLECMEHNDADIEVYSEGSIALALAKLGYEGRKFTELPSWLKSKVLAIAREF